VLGLKDFDVSVPLPKRSQRIPELLTRGEVARILEATHNLKHYMLLATCYGCGLRVSERVAIRVRRDIDGERPRPRRLTLGGALGQTRPSPGL